MRKNKTLKKGMIAVMIFSLVISVMPVINLPVATAGWIVKGSETSPTNPMLHFVMKVRWGNVIGEPVNISESNFDGSVNVSSSARVSLERTLLFEKHNNTADKITERKNPVS